MSRSTKPKKKTGTRPRRPQAPAAAHASTRTPERRREDVRWGIRWGLRYGLALTVFATLAYFVMGREAFVARNHAGLLDVGFFFITGSPVFGGLAGLARPLLRTVWGATGVGMAIGAVAGLWAAVFVAGFSWNSTHSSMVTWFTITGAFVGLLTRLQHRET